MKKHLIKLSLLFLILFGSFTLTTIYSQNNQNTLQTELISTPNNKTTLNSTQVPKTFEKENKPLVVKKQKKGWFKGWKWYWHVLFWVGIAIITIPLTIWKRRWRRKHKK